MKCKLLIIIFFLSFCLFSCKKNENEITENLKFPYDLCEYDGGILISNFGGDTLNYFNINPTGFISCFKNGKNNILIPDGNGLYSPKGLAVKDNFLFVADIGKILVFNLKDKNKKIDEIIFPQNDSLVNDLLVMGSTLFISVTNSNKLYLLNIDKPEKIDHTSLLEYFQPVCPTFLKSEDYYLFIASDSYEKPVTDDNIIQIIDNLNYPSLRPIIFENGKYNGLELSPSKTRLLFLNQQKAGYLGNLVFENGNYNYEQITNENSLLNSLLLINNKLYISDLQNSKIYIKTVAEFDNFPTVLKSDNNKD